MALTCGNMPYKAFTEMIGTFFLVFAGTGAVIVNTMSSGVVTHVGVSLVFAMIVVAVIYATGDISGAHINPAVTIAFCLAGRECWCTVLYYVPAQIFGAVAASFTLKLIFPLSVTMGETMPGLGLSWGSVFLLEVIFSFILMVVILNVSTGAQEKGVMAGVAVGVTVGILALVGGPLTGASMNPARSLGPEVASGDLSLAWLYILAPLIGMALSVPISVLMRKGCVCNDKKDG